MCHKLGIEFGAFRVEVPERRIGSGEEDSPFLGICPGVKFHEGSPFSRSRAFFSFLWIALITTKTDRSGGQRSTVFRRVEESRTFGLGRAGQGGRFMHEVVRAYCGKTKMTVMARRNRKI